MPFRCHCSCGNGPDCIGALAKCTSDNLGVPGELAARARTLIRRFCRYQDMILRFATDLTEPCTNNQAERDIRPVKTAQRNSGGTWRTLQGLTEFAVVHSYLATATKWGKDKFQALIELFTTGPWLPPALAPRTQLNSYHGRCFRRGFLLKDQDSERQRGCGASLMMAVAQRQVRSIRSRVCGAARVDAAATCSTR